MAGKNILRFSQTDFLNRMFLFKNKHEVKLEEMRNKKTDIRTQDYPFKPKLGKSASQQSRRTIEDLYVNCDI